MRLLGEASLATARKVSRSTLGAETFKLEANTGSETDFGTEDGWSVTVAAAPGRLSPERSESQERNGRVTTERRYVLTVHPSVAVAEGNRCTRLSDGSRYRVIGVDAPQTDDAIAKTVRLEKEKNG